MHSPELSFRPRLPRIRLDRPSNRIVIGVAVLAYLVISWMILKANGNPPVRFHLDASRLVDASMAIKVHVAGALSAFVIGTTLMLGVKGRGGCHAGYGDQLILRGRAQWQSFQLDPRYLRPDGDWSADGDCCSAQEEYRVSPQTDDRHVRWRDAGGRIIHVPARSDDVVHFLYHLSGITLTALPKDRYRLHRW